MERLLFWVFAIVGVFCGIRVIWHRNPMSSAIYLVVTMLCLAGFYVLLGGTFVATIQVLVYAGAVMVLMLFVIMMLNLREESLLREGGLGAWLAAAVVGVILVLKLSALFKTYASARIAARPLGFGTIKGVGETLFGQYVLPFELTSILLLIAIIGAVILAKRTT